MTREPRLAGQTVVVIGGSSGIGLETARQARAEGAEAILTGRNAEHLKQASADVGARAVAAFDATDTAALGQFFGGLPGPIDHVMVTGPARTTRRWPIWTTRGRSAISTPTRGWPSRWPGTPSGGYGRAARCCS